LESFHEIIDKADDPLGAQESQGGGGEIVLDYFLETQNQAIDWENGRRADRGATRLSTNISNETSNNQTASHAHDTQEASTSLDFIKPAPKSNPCIGKEKQKTLKQYTRKKRKDRMEDYHGNHSHPGSDDSFSTTQENDSEVYKNLQNHLIGSAPLEEPWATHSHPDPKNQAATRSSQLDQVSSDIRSSQIKSGFEKTSNEEEAHRVHINYSTGNKSSALVQYGDDEYEPETPAQPRLPFPKANLMAPADLFAATQSSPHDPRLLLSNSSRPSPGMFGFGGAASSVAPPRFHEHLPMESPGPADSSPSQQTPINARQAIRADSAIATSSFQRSFAVRVEPQPYDTYRTRQESQERRNQQKEAYEESDSDESLFDQQALRKLKRRQAQEIAQKELAKVSVTMTPIEKKKKDEVEVPETVRRRSAADDYHAQCTGFDARDSQYQNGEEDEVIADSQTEPKEQNSSTEIDDIILAADSFVGKTPKQTEQPDEEPTQEPTQEATQEGSSQLPALVDTTSGASEPSKSPEQEQQSPLKENKDVSSVPETSPLKHSFRPFDIEDQRAVPDGMELSSDPPGFTQDPEYNVIFSPIRIPMERQSKPLQPIMVSHLSESSTKHVHMEESVYTTAADVLSSSPVRQLTRRSRFAKSLEIAKTKTTEVFTETQISQATTVAYEGETLVQDDEDPSESPTRERLSSSSLSAAPSLPSDFQPSQVGAKDAEIPVLSIESSSIPENRHVGLRSKDESHKISRASTAASDTHHESNMDDNSEPASSAPVAKTRTRAKRASAINALELMASSRQQSMTDDSDRDERSRTPSKRTRSKLVSNISGLFAGMIFAVSYGDEEKEKQKLITLIKTHAGHLIENSFQELFVSDSNILTSPTISTASGSVEGDLILTNFAKHAGFACLIADSHSRRTKFIQALALGLPCLSGRWITDCVARNQILDWEPYLLAAGKSDFLNGAIRSRYLQPYDASTARFIEIYSQRRIFLENQSVMLIIPRAKASEDKKAIYLFLCRALGAKRVIRVCNNEQARTLFLDSERSGQQWDWVYSYDQAASSNGLFGDGKAGKGAGKGKKRKREVQEDDELVELPKKVKVTGDEFVIQSLILGRLIDVD
jgi:hypothetical protein